MKIKVLLVDDQVMVRKGFRLLLEAEEDMQIVGEAENGAEAISQINKINPDVVLMDIQMPVMDGLKATRKRSDMKPDISTRVLILTTFEKDEYIFEALRSGASGFLLKNACDATIKNNRGVTAYETAQNKILTDIAVLIIQSTQH